MCEWVHARNIYTTFSLHVSILGFAPEFSARKWQRTPLSGLPCSCSTEAQAGLWPALHHTADNLPYYSGPVHMSLLRRYCLWIGLCCSFRRDKRPQFLENHSNPSTSCLVNAATFTLFVGCQNQVFIFNFKHCVHVYFLLAQELFQCFKVIGLQGFKKSFFHQLRSCSSSNFPLCILSLFV